MNHPFRPLFAAVALAALSSTATAATPAAPAPEVLSVKKIWDGGPHNAFTDLIRWHDLWWCTFRESDGHVGGDGTIRVLVSSDGERWESAALLAEAGVDLRDPKFSVTPDGRLMLNCGGTIYVGTKGVGKRSRVFFSTDGRTWTPPRQILAEWDWNWRVTWHDGVAYAAVYLATTATNEPGPEWTVSIHRSTDGLNWELVRDLGVPGRPNEMTLRFAPNGDMIALVRREAGDRMGYIGHASPPYREWTWQVSNHRFGGQNLLLLPDGRWIVGTRDYTGTKPGSTAGSRTMIAQLGTDGALTPLVRLPSDGDTSYPGLVWHEGVLWVSYYSSHEGKTSIYLARVKL